MPNLQVSHFKVAIKTPSFTIDFAFQGKQGEW